MTFIESLLGDYGIWASSQTRRVNNFKEKNCLGTKVSRTSRLKPYYGPVMEGRQYSYGTVQISIKQHHLITTMRKKLPKKAMNLPPV